MDPLLKPGRAKRLCAPEPLSEDVTSTHEACEGARKGCESAREAGAEEGRRRPRRG